MSQNLISERDVERERMRRELIASRERLHQQLTHGYTTNTNTTTTTTVTTYNDPATTTSTTTTTTCNDPTAAARESRPSSLISGNSSTDMDEGRQERNCKFKKKKKERKSIT